MCLFPICENRRVKNCYQLLQSTGEDNCNDGICRLYICTVCHNTSENPYSDYGDDLCHPCFRNREIWKSFEPVFGVEEEEYENEELEHQELFRNVLDQLCQDVARIL